MKSALLTQYQAIRLMIQQNVTTIGQLIKQAQNLRELATSIEGNGGNAELKKKLEAEIEQIENTIETLIKQTDSLFESYSKFVEEVLSK